MRRWQAAVLAGVLGACGGDEDAMTVQGMTYEPRLAVIEQEIFAKSCTFSSCHGEHTPRAGLNLAGSTYDRLVGVASTQVPTRTLVIPGDPDGSYLMEKLTKDKPAAGVRMPYLQPPLSDERLAAIRTWITRGAPRD